MKCKEAWDHYVTSLNVVCQDIIMTIAKLFIVRFDI